MGFFQKKRANAGSDSVLTESEIQKKLYGDILSQVPHVAIGERERFSDPVVTPTPSRKAISDKDPVEDLFFQSKGSLTTPEVEPPASVAEKRSSDNAPRYVPLHDFESRTTSQLNASSFADASARTASNRPQQQLMNSVVAICKNLLSPKHSMLRRGLVWGGAILVVFLLFFGVNALNSQREVALRVRYNMPREHAPAPAQAVIPSSVSSVVNTAASVKPKVAFAPRTSGPADVTVTPAPVKNSYVIQVVTYPTRSDAEQIVASFKKAGVPAFVKENSRPSGRLFYLVLIGSFRTEAEAQAHLSKFKTKDVARPFQDAFVKATKT